MAIVKVEQKTLPRVSNLGTDQRSHNAMWEIETNEPHASDHVVLLAQDGGALPVKGDALAVASGLVIPNVAPSQVANWVNADLANRYADGGAICLDIEAAPINDGRDGGMTKNHRVEIVFRAPTGSVGFDQRKWLPRFANTSLLPRPGKVTGSIPTTPSELMSEINNGANPLLEPKNVRTEYVTYQVLEDTAYPVEIAANGPQMTSTSRLSVVNPFGEPYPPHPVTRRNRMVTIQAPVSDGDLFVYLFEEMYGNTLNAGPFAFEGQTIPKWHAKFEGAEASDRLEQNGVSYQVLTWRVQIAAIGRIVESGFVRGIPQTAKKFIERTTVPVGPTQTLFGPNVATNVLTDSEGNPTGERVMVTNDGFLAETKAEQGVIYAIHHKLADYTNILDALGE